MSKRMNTLVSDEAALKTAIEPIRCRATKRLVSNYLSFRVRRRSRMRLMAR
jgi:hypothetical protein